MADNGQEQVLVGEVEAGRAAKVRREINKLVSSVNASTFDLAERLYDVKTNQFFTGYGYETFSKYLKDISGLKASKGFYLTKIVSLMRGADVSREQYEAVGLTKLRAISKLSLEGEFNGVPMPLVINQLTLKAAAMDYEQVVEEVNKLLGLTEDESMVWLNFCVKKSVRDLVILPAIALATKNMPESQKVDDEGNHIDPSNGAAMECICADFLASPEWNPPEIAKDEVDQEGNL
jgi:hypothetical protein